MIRSKEQNFEALLAGPTMTVEQWAELTDTSRNGAYAAVARNEVEGVFRVGRAIKIATAPWRRKLGLDIVAA